MVARVWAKGKGPALKGMREASGRRGCCGNRPRWPMAAGGGAPPPLLPNRRARGRGGRGKGWLTSGPDQSGTNSNSRPFFLAPKITKFLLELDKITKIILQQESPKKSL